MFTHLKNVYALLLVPVVLGTALLWILDRMTLLPYELREARPFISTAILTLAALCAVGLPIFYRAYFAHTVRLQKTVSRACFLAFERNLILIALLAPYWGLLAFGWKLPRFYFTGTLLMALYAVYYFYPSRKRLRYDTRIFRVQDGTS
jgi:hypothetical protein